MVRKIFSAILIVLSTILLLLSLVGIGAVWYYKGPLTDEALARLGEVEQELAQTQIALQDAGEELERTLRIVDSAEQTLESLSEELAQAKKMFDEFDKTLGDSLIPGQPERYAGRATCQPGTAQFAAVRGLEPARRRLVGEPDYNC